MRSSATRASLEPGRHSSIRSLLGHTSRLSSRWTTWPALRSGSRSEPCRLAPRVPLAASGRLCELCLFLRVHAFSGCSPGDLHRERSCAGPGTKAKQMQAPHDLLQLLSAGSFQSVVELGFGMRSLRSVPCSGFRSGNGKFDEEEVSLSLNPPPSERRIGDP